MPHDVDIHVGMLIRRRRAEVEMTQAHLADKIGVTFQQVQKYETGRNRVSASRPFGIAAVLGVPVQHFFDGIGDVVLVRNPQ